MKAAGLQKPKPTSSHNLNPCPNLQVIVSLAAVAAFALIGLPAIYAVSGIGGVFKFWLMPWLGYHFWMSTFTVVHHTAAHIPFKPASEWNAAKAQLSGTVHCDFPKWCAAVWLFESLCANLAGRGLQVVVLSYCLAGYCLNTPGCEHKHGRLRK